ncbi:hypothetical protein SFC43_27715 [Bacteroides sp. CR5/BHMF/2]|nr:hypothetical protein [Bacteroides sp. CR5/BHMF/2]
MKTKRYLVQGFLLLFCSMTAIAGSPSEELQHPQHPQKQEGKRPRIQTSASEKEIVFKPNAETGKVETAKTQAVKAIGKERKETAAKPKRSLIRRKLPNATGRSRPILLMMQSPCRIWLSRYNAASIFP